jgi:hypothetical protein
MAGENVRTWWHLTQQGWQRGATADSPDAIDQGRPDDTLFSVLTFDSEAPEPPYLNVEFKRRTRSPRIKPGNV